MEINKALMEACDIGNLAAVEEAIDEGANVNYKDRTGSSPLLVASINGNIKLAKLLIEKGADVNVKDLWNITPLSMALERNDKEMVKFLLSNGATIGKYDTNIPKRENRPDILDILEKWPHSMAVLALQENKVYNQMGMDDLENLDAYMGKKGEHYGGKRKNKKSKKGKSRKSKKSIRKIKKA
jgi:ankyrin repeat protein